MPPPRCPRILFCLLAFLLCSYACASAGAQGTVPAVLLSDIHFDPFHNPRDVAELLSAPVERWPAILNASNSLVEDAKRATIQAECHALSFDTTWPLLKQALTAAHDAQPHPVFITLSGDLLTHEFQCRFQHAVPDAGPEQMSAFAAKTVAFVAFELRQTFPHIPVYVALGNNDSGCADYDETPGNAFARSTTATMLMGTGGAGGVATAQAKIEVSPEGDYSLDLPEPLRHGRLIVLQDVFDSQYFLICGGGNERGPENNQIAWLRKQLTEARERHQQVWVMGHIPPGVDVYASFHKYVLRPGELCTAPVHPFLQDTQMADTLLDFADIVRLGLFAHTHMDEIRILSRPANPSGSSGIPTRVDAVPLKLVPSVTPYFGNHPAFLVASIDPSTLVLKDWQTFVSPGLEGSAAPWPAAYRFSTAYGLPSFSAGEAAELAAGFISDRSGKASRSSTYREHFFAGDIGIYSLGLAQIWPAYACAVRQDRTDAFHNCLCPAGSDNAH